MSDYRDAGDASLPTHIAPKFVFKVEFNEKLCEIKITKTVDSYFTRGFAKKMQTNGIVKWNGDIVLAKDSKSAEEYATMLKSVWLVNADRELSELNNRLELLKKL